MFRRKVLFFSAGLPKALLMFKIVSFIFCNGFALFYTLHFPTYTLLCSICYLYDIMKCFVRNDEIKLWYRINNWVSAWMLCQIHDDVIQWKHFPRYWPFVRVIHWSPVNSPHKGKWRGALLFSFICTRINGWVNNGEAGDLRRYRAHFDVTVMCIPFQAIYSESTPL